MDVGGVGIVGKCREGNVTGLWWGFIIFVVIYNLINFYMTLKTTYLKRLDVAHHDNVTQAIYDRIAKINAEEGSKLATASNKLKLAREEEDRC